MVPICLIKSSFLKKCIFSIKIQQLIYKMDQFWYEMDQFWYEMDQFWNEIDQS